MADSSNTTTLDIEALNQLALRLDDAADSITNVAAHEMEKDIRTAARVASWAAHVRFVVAEIADAMPVENPAKKELLTLIGKQEG
jgi:hypothetical protein